jgi:peroxiredoxin
VPLAVGESAPPVALGDQHGKPFRLAEALQQRELVVLAFYVKAFTGG